MAYRTLADALALGSGVERPFICHVHDDHNASASVNAITGLWICYSCGARGKVNLDDVEVPTHTVDKLLQATQEAVLNPLLPLDDSYLDLFDAVGPGEYWLSRYASQTCQDFRLGYSHHDHAATYPLRALNGSLLGVVLRPLDVVGKGPKYRYPYGVKISELLFGYDRCTDDVIVITEGATDAIACFEVGVDAMATYGSNISRAQVTALHKYNPARIVLGHDQDAAGDHAAERVKEHFPQAVRLRWPVYKDLAEMPIQERANTLRSVFDERLH